jgi:hypothetical protein
MFGTAHPLQSVAAVVELPADGLGEVWPVRRVLEVTHGGDGLRPDQQDGAAGPGGDGGGHLGDQVLRALTACDVEDRFGGVDT